MQTAHKPLSQLSPVTDYLIWRAAKLSGQQPLKRIEIDNQLSPGQKQALIEQIARHNMALFRVNCPSLFSARHLKQLGYQFGLFKTDNNLHANEEAISILRVSSDRSQYIPYTDRPLQWHTDGYYNPPDKIIQAFSLYCLQPAKSGGENHLLDPDLAYIHLYDTNPRYITALSANNVMTIPAHYQANKRLRPQQTSPVFQIKNNQIYMRYTQRKQHIQWKNDPLTQEALALLKAFLQHLEDPIICVRLEQGDGIICRNILHNRSAFQDTKQQQRTLYRIRYHDPIDLNYQPKDDPDAKPQ